MEGIQILNDIGFWPVRILPGMFPASTESGVSHSNGVAMAVRKIDLFPVADFLATALNNDNGINF